MSTSSSVSRPSRRRVAVVAAIALVAMAAGSSLAFAPERLSTRPGSNVLVSVGTDGESAKSDPTTSPNSNSQGEISADGRYVLFESHALNLVPGRVPRSNADLYWRDLAIGRTKQVNVSSLGVPELDGPTGGEYVPPGLSADGRYVLFSTGAPAMVPGDTNGAQDVFRHDTRTGETVRASVGSGGTQIPGGATEADISGDGRYVVFVSPDDRVVAGDTNGVADVFLHDFRTNRTTRISVSSSGAQADAPSGVNRRGVAISRDGRYVAFSSLATNLVPGTTTSQLCNCRSEDIYWRDLKAGKTVRVSVASGGAQAAVAGHASCALTNPGLTLPDPVGYIDLGTHGAVEVCGSQLPYWGGNALSDDGRFILFQSTATNLVPNDANSSGPMFKDGRDYFVHDVRTRRTERVSVDSLAQESWGLVDRGSLSGDGRFVSFTGPVGTQAPPKGGSPACVPASLPVVGQLPPALTNVPGVGGGCEIPQALVYDRSSGALELVVTSPTGGSPRPGKCWGTGRVEHTESESVGISGTGRYVLVSSRAQGLTSNDTNGVCDYFVRDRGAVLGVGALVAPGEPGPDEPPTCIADPICLPPVGQEAIGRDPAGDLLAARIVLRSNLRDLFVRLDVRDLPAATSTAASLVYGVRFTAKGTRYEVRMQHVLGLSSPGAVFGLFREDPATGVYTNLRALEGGYGTIGSTVAAAVPLTALGVSSLSQLKDASAFTATGSYHAGSVRLIDTMRLR